MLNHNQLNELLIDYCVNDLKFDKDCHTKYSFDNNGFGFTMGEFMTSPVLPKNALLVGISEKGASVSKVICFTHKNREIVCFLNYSDKEITSSSDNAFKLFASVKNSINKINSVLEAESQMIESSKDAIDEVFEDQKKVGIPLLNINIGSDGSPGISYTVIPTE